MSNEGYDDWEYQYEPDEGNEQDNQQNSRGKGKRSGTNRSGTKYDWSHKKRQLEFLMKKDFDKKMAAKEKELQDQFSQEKADMAAQYEDQIKRLQQQIEQDELQKHDELAALQTFMESGFEQERQAREQQMKRQKMDELNDLKTSLEANFEKQRQAQQQQHVESMQAITAQMALTEESMAGLRESTKQAQTVFDAMTDLQAEHDKALARIKELEKRDPAEPASNVLELERQHKKAMMKQKAKYTAFQDSYTRKLKRRGETIDRLKTQVQEFEGFIEQYTKKYRVKKTKTPQDGYFN